MAKSFNAMTSDVRKFIYTKLYKMNDENTLSFEELLEKTASFSMESRGPVNGGPNEGFATSATVLDPNNNQNEASADNQTTTTNDGKTPVEKFNEQKMISGNSTFFITVAGTELPEEVYSLTAAQKQLQEAQRQGIKFFKYIDQDGVAQYFRAGKTKVKIDEKFGDVGKSDYEKLTWPKVMKSKELGGQRPILVNREVRENMPEGLYGKLKLEKVPSKLVPIITAAVSVGVALSVAIGSIGGVQPHIDPQNEITPDNSYTEEYITEQEGIEFIEQEDVVQEDVLQEGVEQGGVALGGVFTLDEGVSLYYTANEAMEGKSADGNGEAVIGNQYCSPEDNYYIDGFAVLDENGNVIDTNFETYGMTRNEYIESVAEEKGLNSEDLTVISHFSQVGEGVSLDENGDMIYDGSSNVGWMMDDDLQGQYQGSLEELNMLNQQQTPTAEAEDDFVL